MFEENQELLTFADGDILDSVGSDLCESIRDLIYNIKTIKNDLEIVKSQLRKNL